MPRQGLHSPPSSQTGVPHPNLFISLVVWVWLLNIPPHFTPLYSTGSEIESVGDGAGVLRCGAGCAISFPLFAICGSTRSMFSALLIYSPICLKRPVSSINFVKGAAACGLVSIVAKSSFKFFLSFRASFHLSYAYPEHCSR